MSGGHSFLNRSSRRFVLALIGRHRVVAAAVLGGSLAAAALEGLTMGLFALALQSLGQPDSGPLAAHYGALGSLADGWRQQLGADGLFLLLVGIAVAAQVGRSAMRLGADLAAAHLQAEVEGEVRRSIFRRLMAFPYPRLRSQRVGDLASYLEQVNYVGQVVMKANTMLEQLLLLAAYTAVLLWLSVPGTVLSVIGMLLVSGALRTIVRRIRRVAGAYKRALVRLAEQAVEFLNGARVLKALAREPYAIERMDATIADCVDHRRRGMGWQASLSPLLDSLAVLGVGGLLAGGYLLIGTADRSMMVRFATFLFVLYRLMPRLSIVNKNWGWMHNSVPFVERIVELLTGGEGEEEEATGGRRFTSLQRAVELEQLSLRYPGRGEWAVHDLSLRIGKGETVALVGESGAGKSTVIDLLLGFHPPTAGRILVDGVALDELDPTSWRRRLGVVSQATFLFSGTVRDNLTLGLPGIGPEQVEAAARAALADGFIRRLPDGYDTLVGTEGSQLSGGQRQRIALARALLSEPEILILDEATSELDHASALAVNRAVDRLWRGRTRLVVAHHLELVVGADRIAVLKSGRLVETGSHAELLAASGEYSRLWSKQTGSAAAAPLGVS